MKTFKEFAEQINPRALEICRYLLPKGKSAGGEYTVGDVFGAKGQSLNINLSKGVFFDHSTLETGDLLQLWCLNRSVSLLEGKKAIECYLGLSAEISFNERVYRAPRKPVQLRPKGVTSLKAIISKEEHNSVLEYLKSERKLTDKTIERFRISCKSDSIVFPFFADGKLSYVKYLGINRPNGVRKIWSEPDGRLVLFGWQAIDPNAREIVICEGEIDAMSLSQYGYNALSLPNGIGSVKAGWLEEDYERLSVYDKIYICLDGDAAGSAAAEPLAKKLGVYRTSIVSFEGFKDANEALQTGVEKAVIDKFFSDAAYIPHEDINSPMAFLQEVLDAQNPEGGVEAGIRTPWASVGDKIIFRPSELSIWSGVNTHGKTQALGHIMLETIKQGSKVLVMSLEMKPNKLLLRLTRQAAAMRHPSPSYTRHIFEQLEGKMFIYSVLGSITTSELYEAIEYANKRYDVDVFVVDSLMLCGVGVEDNAAQKKLIEGLCELRAKLDIHIHLVAHMRKPLDDKYIGNRFDIKGTGAIADLADNIYIVWRNKAKEAKVEYYSSHLDEISDEDYEKLLNSPDAKIKCDKQRHGECEPTMLLWFDFESLRYKESRGEKPRRYYEYSSSQAFEKSVQ